MRDETPMTEKLKNQKSLLAKLMATENLTVVHRAVPTAYFDLDTRTLCCPVFKDDISPELYDLFMGHEVGHALKTPYEGLHSTLSENPTLKGYLNVVEDVRIESYIKDKYQGLRRSFYTAYNELMERDFFGVTNKNLQALALIDKINLITKVGSRVTIALSEEEQKYLDMARNCKTWEDVVECANAIYEYSGRVESQMQPEPTMIPDPDSNDKMDGEDTEEPDGEGNAPEESEDGDSEESEDGDSGESEPNAGDMDQEESGEDEKGEEGDDFQADNGAGEGMAREAITETNAHSNESMFIDEDAMATSQIDMRDIFKNNDISKIFVPHTEMIKSFDDWISTVKPERLVEPERHVGIAIEKILKKNSKIVNQMVKDFQIKQTAARMVHASTAKTGKLDMNRLAKYKIVDDIFKRTMVVPDGKNHGIFVLLDWSASIIRSVPDLLEQAIILSEFCRKTEIPHRICLFTDQYRGGGIDRGSHMVEVFSDTMKSSVYRKQLRNVMRLWYGAFNRRNRFDYAGRARWATFFGESVESSTGYFELEWNPYEFGLGGTPLDTSIIALRQFLPQFRSSYGLEKMILTVVTDGYSHASDMLDVTAEEWSVIGQQTESNKAERQIIDPVSRKTYRYSRGWVRYGSQGFRSTQNLLHWISSETGCTVTGHFFLTSKHDYKSLAHYLCQDDDVYGRYSEEWTEMMTKWPEARKTGIVLDAHGYNKLFVTTTSNMGTSGDEYLDDSLSGATARKLTTAFKKNQASKSTSRFLTNEFIKEIA